MHSRLGKIGQFPTGAVITIMRPDALRSPPVAALQQGANAAVEHPGRNFGGQHRGITAAPRHFAQIRRDHRRHNQRRDPERMPGRVCECRRHGVGSRLANRHKADIDAAGAAELPRVSSARVTVVTRPIAMRRNRAASPLAAMAVRTDWQQQPMCECRIDFMPAILPHTPDARPGRCSVRQHNHPAPNGRYILILSGFFQTYTACQGHQIMKTTDSRTTD